MQNTRSRINFALFLITILTFVWATIGLITKPIDVTLFWGVGLGLVIFLVFLLSITIKIFGFSRSIISYLVILLIIFGGLVLNNYRSWPFGMVYYHDILGWKILKTLWVLPLFWSLVTLISLILTRPVKIQKDPKALFSWSFDAAILVMLYSLIIEPTASQLKLSVWPVEGQILGVPFSAFLGWFVISFIASVGAITAGKLWEQTKSTVNWCLPAILIGFHIILLILSIKADVVVLEIFNLIAIAYYIFKLYQIKKSERSESLNPTVPQMN